MYFETVKDLVNWHDEEHIIPPELENKDSLLHTCRRLDRPHIIRNRGKVGVY